MTIVRRALFVLLLLPAIAFAQTADQEVVSVVDAPDPVTPGATLSYTVTLTNHGPDPATGGGLNINLPGGMAHTTDSVPAGFTCFWLGNNGTCNQPSLPVGTYVLTINATIDTSLAAFPDQNLVANFFPSGTTIDPNNANNAKTATTTVDSPQVDLSLTATDSPDPVFPDGTVTYSVTLTNSGPDTASSVNFNVVPNSSLAFQSVTVPAGWSCVTPAVGALNATFTCSRATWAPGTSNFTVVFSANDENFGINDTSFQTYFGVFASASDETDDSQDNDDVVTTQYTTPDADLNITATDSPDPVSPDGDITYTVTVTNQGPDTPTNTTMDVPGNGGQTRFVSLTAPAGWTCNPPAPGTLLNVAGFQCTHPSFSNGSVAVFTVVTEASDDLHPNSDHNITQVFQAFSNISDPDNPDNMVTVTTAYVVNDADMNITVSDSPDPVSPDGDITYTVTVTNQGPDSATNPTMTIGGNGGQTRFQSIVAPAGWTCDTPAPGTLLNVASYTCTAASLANGASAVFTVVTEASDDLHPNSDHTITQVFLTGANEADPDNPDNSETETTAYVVNDADMNITATDSPDPVSPDGDITYTVTVTNQGPDPATNATMTIVGNGGQTRFQSIVAPAGWTCNTPAAGTLLNATNYECTIASLANGASAVFTVVTEASDDLHPNSDHNITQNFMTGANEADPDGTDNLVQVTTLYDVSNADISVTNSDAPDPVAPGDTITYTQSITNNGPDAAANATFSQSTPAGTTFQSLVAPAGWTCGTPAVGATGAITCSKASMAVSESGTFTLVVNVTGTGTITSTVTGGSSANDPDPADNTASVTTTSIGPASADLSITKTTPAATAPDGSTITYTIVVTNNGPDAATNVEMTDTLPATLLFRSITEPAGFDCTTPAVGTSGTITCTAATLANGASRTFTLVVEANGTSGSVTNSAAVSSDATDGNPGNSGSTSSGVTLVPAEADLEITKTTASTVATPGATVTYTITVTNAGPSSATNVVVTDDLPAGLAFISATPSQGTCNASDPVSCNLGTIVNGGSATITLSAQVTATSGTISNTASVTSTEGDTDTTTSTPIPVGAAAVAAVPTVSEWGLMMLAMMLAVAAALKMRG
ncbi:MAG TPA: DUF11 domain-containing protein [Thermoanaerobaculia bacterium]